MAKIYLPTEYVNLPCKVVNNGYIRVYENDNYNSYFDIYINQDYMVKPGTSNYSQSVACDSVNEYTDAIYYRTDIDKIMLVFILMVGFCYFFIHKLIRVFFHGFREA